MQPANRSEFETLFSTLIRGREWAGWLPVITQGTPTAQITLSP